MIKKEALEVLRRKEFVSIGTADKKGSPNAVPKFLLKIEKNFVYLIDYTLARTAANLAQNPKASLSFVDINNLIGYRLDGPASVIEKGKEFDKIAKELKQKLISLSADRVIEASRTGRRTGHYELEIPDKFLVIKIRVREVAKLGSQGDLWKEKN
jgi:uncharacterized protein